MSTSTLLSIMSLPKLSCIFLLKKKAPKDGFFTLPPLVYPFSLKVCIASKFLQNDEIQGNARRYQVTQILRSHQAMLYTNQKGLNSSGVNGYFSRGAPP